VLLNLAVILSVIRTILIPVQFQDTQLSCKQEEISVFCEDISSYFKDQGLSVSIDVAPTVTLNYNLSYYGRNGQTERDYQIRSAVLEACRGVDSKVDFSLYDNKSAGEVDCVILLAAGGNEADGEDEDLIWPQQGFLKDRLISLILDSKKIDTYVVVPELRKYSQDDYRFNGIGELCHEFSHVLGLPDLYDSDGEAGGGNARALWNTSLMSYGCRNNHSLTPPNLNAIERELLSTGKEEILQEGSYLLEPINREGRYIKAPTNDGDEYFLIECREAEGWDKYIGGSGLLVYHIDKRRPDFYQAWLDNKVNCNPDHQCAALLEAVPGTSDPSMIFYPQKGASSITSETPPRFRTWDSKQMPIAITGISRSLDGCILFDAIVPITITGIASYQDAATINWSTHTSLKGKCFFDVTWQEKGSSEVHKLEGIKETCCTMEGLKSGTSYICTVFATDQKGNGYSVNGSFDTKKIPAGTHPYIYLGTVKREPGGEIISGSQIPLRIYNAVGISHVEWTFADSPICTGHDGMYTILVGGELRALVTYQDGTTDVIIKEMKVK